MKKIIGLCIFCVLLPLVSCGQGTTPALIPSDTVVGNFSGVTALGTPQNVPSCANDGGHALTNNSGSGFNCTAISGTTAASVISVSNADGTLTITPTVGSVSATLALGKANTWTATQTFPSNSLTFGELPQISTSNVLGNFSGGTANVAAQSVPSCANDGNHSLTNNGGSGFNCTAISGTTASVTSVSAADSSLTITPTTGAVLARLANMAADTVKCNLTGSSAAPTDCTGIILKGTSLTNQIGGASGKWFTDDTPQGTFLYVNDRLFVGGSAANNGASTGSLSGDWFSIFQSGIGVSPGYIFNAQEALSTSATNPNAGTGLLAAAQSKNFTGTGNAIGVSSIGVNNNTTQTGISWGFYSECHVTSTAHFADCYGIEVDPRTAKTTGGQPDPYQQAFVVGLQDACGAGLVSTGFPCGGAIQILANPETFNVGINFENGSITSGAAGGNTAAISMPTGYQLIWYSAAGTIVGSIGFDGSGNMVVVAAGCLKVNGTCVTVP